LSRLGAGVLGWGQPGASTPWKRAFDACGCIAADLYFQQLGTVSTQHSANVKVYCWDEVGDRDKWSDPEFHIDIVHIPVDRSELREGPWRANRPVLLRWFHSGITRATNHWGWDPEPFDSAFNAVMEGTFELVHHSKPKWSPNRQQQARAVAVVEESQCTAWIEVMDKSGRLVDQSEPVAFAGQGLWDARRRIHELKWLDSLSIQVSARGWRPFMEPEWEPLTLQVRPG
jgi:hypothetical protein